MIHVDKKQCCEKIAQADLGKVPGQLLRIRLQFPRNVRFHVALEKIGSFRCDGKSERRSVVVFRRGQDDDRNPTRRSIDGRQLLGLTVVFHRGIDGNDIGPRCEASFFRDGERSVLTRYATGTSIERRLILGDKRNRSFRQWLPVHRYLPGNRGTVVPRAPGQENHKRKKQYACAENKWIFHISTGLTGPQK